MAIFINRNHKDQIVGIVSAADDRSARAYWQGLGIVPSKLETFDMAKDRENEALGYVTPILETAEVDSYQLRNRSEKVLVIK